MRKEILDLLKENKDKILSLKDNWEEGFKAHNINTWNKLEKFLQELNPKKLPEIFPATEGSINLEWDNPDLLIEIPEEEEELISLYGINKHKIEIKGYIPPITLEEINNFLESE